MGEPEAKSSDYDVIVVGSGPAGISAAINVANRQRTVALMGGQTPFGRLRKAHVVANYPGFGSVGGEELAEAFVRHLGEFQVPVIGEKASKIIPAEDGFVVFTEREFYQARALVLATGVYREAGIEGEEDLVGQGVSYCVTCDGRLFRGRRAAFISYAAEGEEEASVLADDYELGRVVLQTGGRIHMASACISLRAGKMNWLEWVLHQHRTFATYRLCNPLGSLALPLTHDSASKLVRIW